MVKNVKNLGKILRIGLENGWVEKDHFLGYKGKTKNVDRYIISIKRNWNRSPEKSSYLKD